MHTKEWYAEGERSATLYFKFKQEFFVLICSSLMLCHGNANANKTLQVVSRGFEAFITRWSKLKGFMIRI